MRLRRRTVPGSRLLGLLALSLLAAGNAWSVTVSHSEVAVNDATGETIPAVAVSRSVEVDATVETSVARATYGSLAFTHWTHADHPDTAIRDAWGRAFNPIRFTARWPSVATAHYRPSAADTDADGVADWFEFAYFGGLGEAESADHDGDGLTLRDESLAGTHPRYGNFQRLGGVAWVDSALVTANLAGYPRYTIRSEPAGRFSQSAFVEPGTVVTVPDETGVGAFGHWLLDGVRQQDAWGVALARFDFVMGTTDREAVGYFPSGDTDADGVGDAYEYRYYGSLDQPGDADTDADGLTLAAEYQERSHPLFGNRSVAGGVAWADSSLVQVNLSGFPRYLIRSEPAGVVSGGGVVAPGTSVTTPDLAGRSSFGYWLLDGVRQEDAWGVALGGFSFIVGETDREAVAYCPAGDQDGDGVPDAFEMRYLGTLAHGASFDGDGDGISLLMESIDLTHPRYANRVREGGVAWAASGLISTRLLSTFAAWQEHHFTLAERQDPAVSGPSVVLTPDGYANLAKYALGFGPREAVRLDFELGWEGSELTFTYRRAADPTDLSVTVEASGDLGEWTTEGVEHALVVRDGGSEIWRARVAVPAVTPVFLRLRFGPQE